MEKKSWDFSMKEAQKLAQTPAARQLMDALRAQEPQALDQAMAQAAAGDYAQMQESIRQFMSNPQIRAMIRQLGGGHE